jgi:hypothetical protein
MSRFSQTTFLALTVFLCLNLLVACKTVDSQDQRRRIAAEYVGESLLPNKVALQMTLLRHAASRGDEVAMLRLQSELLTDYLRLGFLLRSQMAEGLTEKNRYTYEIFVQLHSYLSAFPKIYRDLESKKYEMLEKDPFLPDKLNIPDEIDALMNDRKFWEVFPRPSEKNIKSQHSTHDKIEK